MFLKCAFGVMEAVVRCETLARSSIDVSICYPVRRFPQITPGLPSSCGPTLGREGTFQRCMYARVVCCSLQQRVRPVPDFRSEICVQERFRSRRRRQESELIG
jgi:hypothetical protein